MNEDKIKEALEEVLNDPKVKTAILTGNISKAVESVLSKIRIKTLKK